ncbi:cytochrome C assembly family protein [Aliidiomarina minuta]|nr:cytochrome c biogenesis protein CcsA [Aliidiomarina minuta]
MITILLTISILGYGLAVLFMGQSFTSSARWGQRRIWATSTAALAAHILVIALILSETGFRQFNMAATLSIISALLVIFNVSRGSSRESQLLRPVIFTFALVSLVIAAITPLQAGQALTTRPGVTIHVGLSLVAFSVLALAALYSLQLYYLNRLLKNKRAHALSERLPPLMTVESYFFRLLTIGTAILTLAIMSGFLFLENMFAPGQLHKTVLSIAAWLTFNCILIVHYWRGVRGKPIIIFTLIASFILILAYYGSRFVRDIILS